jgi:cysteine-rich repeat protein
VLSNWKLGTDPSNHFSGEPGAGVLIDNAIKFAASGKTSSGASSTGLYFALAHYYEGVDSGAITSLSEFGEFVMRGNLDCYNTAHIVASSPALGTLNDAALSDWSCSVHEAFSKYPTTGMNGFQALAIAKDIIGDGSQTFGDGTIGLPYIISRGATPAGCGDGKWDGGLGEECDDGNTANGDGCSASCKCESGKPKGDGTCLPAPGSNSTTSVKPPVSGTAGTASSYIPSGSAGPYANSSTKYSGTVTPPYPITTTRLVSFLVAGFLLLLTMTFSYTVRSRPHHISPQDTPRDQRSSVSKLLLTLRSSSRA